MITFEPGRIFLNLSFPLSILATFLKKIFKRYYLRQMHNLSNLFLLLILVIKDGIFRGSPCASFKIVLYFLWNLIGLKYTTLSTTDQRSKVCYHLKKMVFFSKSTDFLEIFKQTSSNWWWIDLLIVPWTITWSPWSFFYRAYEHLNMVSTGSVSYPKESKYMYIISFPLHSCKNTCNFILIVVRIMLL